uniref:Uncharacterized protein n=1 Tax=Branchiostoma floridae TaxID=7739 RepID=C3YPT3_BRAFL|eukprot:XP_002601855.1 hypothetical protein BRAFLDRAFT_121145 [Branchiostoma floridae]
MANILAEDISSHYGSQVIMIVGALTSGLMIQMFPLNLLPYVIGAALVLLGAIIFFRRTVLYQGFHNDDEEEDTPYVNDKKIMEALPSCQTIEQAAVEDTEQ